MHTMLTPEMRKIIEAVHYRPAVSILMPFEPKMSLKSGLALSLKVAALKVKEALQENYPDEMSMLVMLKLKAIIQNLNFNTHKSSIAIYVSPVFEKALYLDIALEERIIVDESFELRDLVYSKKQMHKYLVLLFSEKESRIFLGNTTTLIRIVSNTPESVYTHENGIPAVVEELSDMPQRKDRVMDKFLHHIDNALDIILHAYHLPLFVVGTEKILAHFKNVTKHPGAVIEYLNGDFEEFTLEALMEKLKPFITDWKKVKQKDILNQLEEASAKKKLAAGMPDVWRAAMDYKGRLLVVEKNYMFPAKHGNMDEVIKNAIEPYSKFSYIKDAVDEVMEKVLENGGNVEFVEEGILKAYHQIALVQS